MGPEGDLSGVQGRYSVRPYAASCVLIEAALEDVVVGGCVAVALLRRGPCANNTASMALYFAKPGCSHVRLARRAICRVYGCAKVPEVFTHLDGKIV